MADPTDLTNRASTEFATDAARTGGAKEDGATWTSDDLARWADLIAAGELSFPRELSPAVENALVTAVRQRRRERLIQFIARLIARDLRQESAAAEGVRDDDSTTA